jgi:hypothetical protein
MRSTNTLDPTIIETGIRAADGKFKIINDFLRKSKLKKVRIVNSIDDFTYDLIFEDAKELMIFQLRGGLKSLINYVKLMYEDPFQEELSRMMAEQLKNQIDQEILEQLLKGTK